MLHSLLPTISPRRNVLFVGASHREIRSVISGLAKLPLMDDLNESSKMNHYPPLQFFNMNGGTCTLDFFDTGGFCSGAGPFVERRQAWNTFVKLELAYVHYVAVVLSSTLDSANAEIKAVLELFAQWGMTDQHLIVLLNSQDSCIFEQITVAGLLPAGFRVPQTIATCFMDFDPSRTDSHQTETNYADDASRNVVLQLLLSPTPTTPFPTYLIEDPSITPLDRPRSRCSTLSGDELSAEYDPSTCQMC
jgi:hypothetical protein